MSDAHACSKAILIAGPTASGKSALALALAQHFDGTIINADSMQVYTQLRVLSARPTPDDEARVPHALYGHVMAQDAYSAGRFVSDATGAIRAARQAGRRPILVGGTGLYFKALLEGLAPVPPVPDAVRTYWRAEAERAGAENLHRALVKRDAIMAERLAPTDTQRIVRALEVLDGTGRSLSEWQHEPTTPALSEADTICIRATLDRAELHARADARFDAMMANGAGAEAAVLAALDLDPALPAMRAIGVAPLIAAVRGAITTDEAVARAKLDTRKYIKRQETWAKNNMITWKCISTKEMKSSIAYAIAFIQS